MEDQIFWMDLPGVSGSMSWSIQCGKSYGTSKRGCKFWQTWNNNSTTFRVETHANDANLHADEIFSSHVFAKHFCPTSNIKMQTSHELFTTVEIWL